jgi:hypothetical protein
MLAQWLKSVRWAFAIDVLDYHCAVVPHGRYPVTLESFALIAVASAASVLIRRAAVLKSRL